MIRSLWLVAMLDDVKIQTRADKASYYDLYCLFWKGQCLSDKFRSGVGRRRVSLFVPICQFVKWEYVCGTTKRKTPFFNFTFHVRGFLLHHGSTSGFASIFTNSHPLSNTRIAIFFPPSTITKPQCTS